MATTSRRTHKLFEKHPLLRFRLLFNKLRSNRCNNKRNLDSYPQKTRPPNMHDQRILYLANISNRHHQFKSIAKKLERWRKYWIQSYTIDVDSTRSNGLAMRKQIGSQLVISIMSLTELTTFSPATYENLDHGISQELDPREGATVTTPILTNSATPLPA